MFHKESIFVVQVKIEKGVENPALRHTMKTTIAKNLQVKGSVPIFSAITKDKQEARDQLFSGKIKVYLVASPDFPLHFANTCIPNIC